MAKELAGERLRWLSDSQRPVTDPKHPLHRMPPSMQYPIPQVRVQYSLAFQDWQCALAYRDGAGTHVFYGPIYNDIGYMVEWLQRLFPTAPIRVGKAL